MARKRARIIYNPSSGRQRSRERRLSAMKRLLAERRVEATASATEGPNHASQLARDAADDGVDVVISYGGDGTLNEVLQGVVGSRSSLAVWPGGTGNVVAHDLKMPFRLRRLADVIAAEKTRRVAIGIAESGLRNADLTRPIAECESRATEPTAQDAGIINKSNRQSAISNQQSIRYFLMFAGIGLDASIVRGVDPGLKRLTGQFAFWMSGLKHVFSWQPETFNIEVDGCRFEATFALIGNGKGYGGGIRLTPNARLEDPWFEVYIVPRLKNNFSYVRSLFHSIVGHHNKAAGTLVAGRFVRANSAVEPLVEVDGEVLGPLPMSFEVVPDALSVVVP